uniref:Uncharacterized protein n=1 Tax=Glossina palpalis gambiensis TaxID=67801 RepID=A0A1B0BJT7_9MUSC
MIRIDLRGNSTYLPSTLADFCSCWNKTLAFNYYCVCLRLVLINFQAVSSPNFLTKINQLPAKFCHGFETAHWSYRTTAVCLSIGFSFSCTVCVYGFMLSLFPF